MSEAKKGKISVTFSSSLIIFDSQLGPSAESKETEMVFYHSAECCIFRPAFECTQFAGRKNHKKVFSIIVQTNGILWCIKLWEVWLYEMLPNTLGDNLIYDRMNTLYNSIMWKFLLIICLELFSTFCFYFFVLVQKLLFYLRKSYENWRFNSFFEVFSRSTQPLVRIYNIYILSLYFDAVLYNLAL